VREVLHIPSPHTTPSKISYHIIELLIYTNIMAPATAIPAAVVPMIMALLRSRKKIITNREEGGMS